MKYLSFKLLYFKPFDCSSDAEKYLAPKKACTLGNKEKKSEIAFIGVHI